MANKLEQLVTRYRELGIDNQIDYDKFYLYSLITHSTAIEGSTITELENQIMFDHGVSLKGKSLEEQFMNLDLKVAYEKAVEFAKQHKPYSKEMLISLAALVMKNTGKEYQSTRGIFSSARGDLRLLNVTEGVGGRSYMNYSKVPTKLAKLCKQLNADRAKAPIMSIDELYQLSFDAHYNLATIHPWADGNGLMALLVMNMLQFEFGLIPTKIRKEDKEDYLKALAATRESLNIHIFRDYMSYLMERNILNEITTYLTSIGEEDSSVKDEDKFEELLEHERAMIIGEVVDTRSILSNESYLRPTKSRDKIIALLTENSKLSAAAIGKIIGISTKSVEKHFTKLKAGGIIEHIGPAKGGYWKVK